MSEKPETQAGSRQTPETHQRQADKLSRIPVKVLKTTQPLRKPDWIRVKIGDNEKTLKIKSLLRDHQLHSVCEEAACPNLSECFSKGTATFMIMGDLCTRRCPFCDVAHGKPKPLDEEEPMHLAQAIQAMRLRYVVITSVDRDDLRDGGGAHFAACIQAIRLQSPATKIEILVPDFRGRMSKALEALAACPPDVFNHNLETIPRLYQKARPGADYMGSLKLLQQFKALKPGIPTKSGLMLGLGETAEEVAETLKDLRHHDCDMLTLGQYLQPSLDHLPVERYISPEEFDHFATLAKELGFSQVASAPMVRSSYHADQQAEKLL